MERLKERWESGGFADCGAVVKGAGGIAMSPRRRYHGLVSKRHIVYIYLHLLQSHEVSLFCLVVVPK